MAADLPDTDLARVERWCRQRTPAHARHQVRLEHQTHGRTVTIVERRAPWHPDHGPEWTSRPVAQLRHSTHGWRLYWADSNTRWHLIHDVTTATNVAPLLEVIDDPGRPPHPTDQAQSPNLITWHQVAGTFTTPGVTPLILQSRRPPNRCGGAHAHRTGAVRGP